MRSRRSAIGGLLAVAWTVGAAGLGAAPAGAVGTPGGPPTTYRDFVYPVGATAPSADKPQSKLWINDGSWWALMASPLTNAIDMFELMPDHSWRDTGTKVDDRLNSTADALWDGQTLRVVSRVANGAIRLYRFGYSSITKSYTANPGFPTSVATGGTESATVDLDSAGRLWVAYTQGSQVRMAYTTTPGDDLRWSAPVAIPVPDVTVSADDIAAVMTFGTKVGIMWSDQQSTAFRFAVHDTASAPTASWTMETPLSGSAMADDHINLKSLAGDAQGRVFAAVKTSQGDNGEPGTAPLIDVLVRSATGVWTASVAGTVADDMTRPQLAVDGTNGILYLLSTAPVTGGVVYYKTTPLSDVAFASGRGKPFTASTGATINNPSTTKQTVFASTGLVAIAGDSGARTYYHTELSLEPAPTSADTQAPSTPTGLTGSATAPDTVSLSWTAATDNVAVTAYKVFRDGVTTPIATTTTTSFSDSGLPAAGVAPSHSYTVRAVDAAGNESAPSQSVTVSMPAPAPGGQVTFLGATTGSNAGATAFVDVARPAAATAGSVLIATIDARGNPTITAPAGWTLVRLEQASTTARKATYYRVVGQAAEPASYRWAMSSVQSASASALSYSGVSTTSPVASSAGAVNTTSSSKITMPSVTPSTAGDMVLALGSTMNATSVTPSAGFIERTEAPTAAKFSITGESADRVAGDTVPTGPIVATSGLSGASVGQTLVLRAAG